MNAAALIAAVTLQNEVSQSLIKHSGGGWSGRSETTAHAVPFHLYTDAYLELSFFSGEDQTKNQLMMI